MDSDCDLLQRFAAAGDQTAFTGLVSRHSGMVRGVAWRRKEGALLRAQAFGSGIACREGLVPQDTP